MGEAGEGRVAAFTRSGWGLSAAARVGYSWPMALYVVESNLFAVDHLGRESQGAIGEYKGREKIYLHVLDVGDAEIAKLKTRVDEDGNKQHDRLALPNVEEWWFAVEGEVAWPGIYRPRITSRCSDVDSNPRPAPLSEEDAGRLRKAGVKGV